MTDQLKQHRLDFSQAHGHLWQAVRKLGGEPWNLLHHPQRTVLIQALIDAATELHQKGADFQAVVDPQEPQTTDKKVVKGR